MATQASTAELVAALQRVDGKAEIVAGEIVVMSPTGGLPSRAAAAIYRSLWAHERRTSSGRAYADNTGFLVDLPHRSSPAGASRSATSSSSGSRSGAAFSGREGLAELAVPAGDDTQLRGGLRPVHLHRPSARPASAASSGTRLAGLL
jgi:hypothetical protein